MSFGDADWWDVGDPYASEMPGADYGSDVLVMGSPNSLPTVTDRPESSQGSVWSSIQNILGSIGSTARNVGTAVGTIRRDVSTARAQYNQAQANAYGGNSLGQWWQYSTTAEKMIVGLAAFAVVLVIVKR